MFMKDDAANELACRKISCLKSQEEQQRSHQTTTKRKQQEWRKLLQLCARLLLMVITHRLGHYSSIPIIAFNRDASAHPHCICRGKWSLINCTFATGAAATFGTPLDRLQLTGSIASQLAPKRVRYFNCNKEARLQFTSLSPLDQSMDSQSNMLTLPTQTYLPNGCLPFSQPRLHG